MSKSFVVFRFMLSLVLLLSFQTAANPVNESDPYEKINRSIFSFNQTLDDYFLQPVAKFYVAVTPDPVERGISNLFSNLKEITNASNNLLQGKV